MSTATTQDKYNGLLSVLLQQGRYDEAKGMVIAAMMLALSDDEVPENILAHLIITFSNAVDAQVRDTIKKSTDMLEAIGVDQAKIHEVMARYTELTGAQTNGKPN